MDRIRQHIHRRRRSSASSTTPLQSPTLSASDKRKKSRDNGPPRHLVVTSDTPEFDKTLIHRLEAEGLSVKYLPFLGRGQDLDRDRKDLEKKLSELEDDLEPGERYAVVGMFTQSWGLARGRLICDCSIQTTSLSITGITSSIYHNY